jgi:short-subunit dehydrogenase
MPEGLRRRAPFVPRRIVITGASSGIGKALALRYARSDASLGLLGRHKERLEAVAEECRALGAEVASGVIDVRSRDELKQWMLDFDRAAPVDLVIANAGVMAGTPPGGEIEPSDAAYALIETNVLGLLNTVQPLLPAMMARRRGQIALVSSISGLTPVADSPSYSASKAAVLYYGLSLRDLLRPHGIGVSVICPGYISTPMTEREHGPKPFIMPVEQAAEIIARGVASNQGTLVIPRFFGTMTRITGLMPERIRRWINKSYRFTVGDPL